MLINKGRNSPKKSSEDNVRGTLEFGKVVQLLNYTTSATAVNKVISVFDYSILFLLFLCVTQNACFPLKAKAKKKGKVCSAAALDLLGGKGK
jgi:hypothetical protein